MRTRLQNCIEVIDSMDCSVGGRSASPASFIQLIRLAVKWSCSVVRAAANIKMLLLRRLNLASLNDTKLSLSVNASAQLG